MYACIHVCMYAHMYVRTLYTHIRTLHTHIRTCMHQEAKSSMFSIESVLYKICSLTCTHTYVRTCTRRRRAVRIQRGAIAQISPGSILCALSRLSRLSRLILASLISVCCIYVFSIYVCRICQIHGPSHVPRGLFFRRILRWHR